MKKEKSVKLALISMLSNPDIKLISLDITNDIEEIPPSFNDPMSYPIRKLTGTSHYNLIVYKNDSSISKK
jgi:hypothetical protein